jgi:hypothetical protein
MATFVGNRSIKRLAEEEKRGSNKAFQRSPEGWPLPCSLRQMPDSPSSIRESVKAATQATITGDE